MKTTNILAAMALLLAVANDVAGGGIVTASLRAWMWPAPIVAIDGDTVRQGHERYRLLGFDAPEVRGHCEDERIRGRAAGVRLQILIWTAQRIDLAATGDRDRYGRILARLRLDGRDAGETLIALGHARAYRGGTRSGWCG
jgi:micrococcal nuclease